MIAAMTKNKIIGHGNNLPWKIKEELQYFRATTLNKVIIMGSNTFRSINQQPLPNRQNIVVTRDVKQFNNNSQDHLRFVTTIPESLQVAASINTCDQEIIIIGGREIYKQFLPISNKLYLSIIKHDYYGDVFFPEYDSNVWQLEYRQDYAEFEAQIWLKTYV